ncbi:hypothetical protein GSI_03115 [Ganoderma sinense ZZ0214-1]|uniref:Uncharacterized protein n=1 Tax=Ganoderma sinense ZZ0214-1 TaxID=1077348 RepID=A0A2G8SKQ8_9APHY|nr:hypothetical protein GSI_03115 [Ganoderma sinense ZZ0214-1]
MPDLKFLDELRDGQAVSEPEKTVRVLITQYGFELYALLVCATVDGSLCDNPPHVLAEVLIPEDPVHLEFIGSKLTIRVSWPGKQTFCVRFADAEEDFWETTRVLSEALANRAVMKAKKARLIREALSTVPSVPS